MNRNFWLILSVLWLWTCSGGGDKATGPEEPPIVINLTSLDGQAQKGPFNNGTAINIAELSSSLSPTGRNFSSAITDNTGRFAVANVQLESPYVELRANGYYFNEVSNEISSGQLTLFALSNLTGKTSLNVNILTHLEKNRMQVLMSGDNPKTFAQAKLQAQEEVLAIFDYSRANVPESELLDISQGGAANAKLLAMSAIIQGDLTVGQMSELLANISTDLSADGTLDDSNLQSQLITNTQGLDFAEIRSNLSARFTALGITATIPDFETEIDQFLKPPVSEDINASTAEDTPINITLAASDPEDESLTYTILEVNNATVTLNGNVANYTPDANFNGTDTFTYKANDGTSDSNTGTVTITVNAVDDEPNTIDVATTTDEDVAVAVNLSAEEYDGDSYSFAIINDVSNGTTALNGSTVTYIPNQDFNGEDTFTFEATDDTGRTINVATATITVNPVNDAPTANDVTTSTDENLFSRNNTKIDITYDADNDILFNNNIKGTSSFDSSNSVNITLDGTDVDGDALTYSISSASNGTLSLNNDIVTYVPNQDWNGEDTFTYTANDGALDSNTATVSITVNSVDDAPITLNSEMTIDEDSLDGEFTKITDYATDADGDDLIFIITELPTNGKLCQNAGATCGTVLAVGDTVTGENGIENSNPFYMPNENFHGSDSFSWKANDGLLDSNIATVIITVNSINDAPVAEDKSISLDEDWQGDGTQYYPMKLIASDVDNTGLTFSVVNNPLNGDLGNGFYSNAGNGANADSIAYKPNANWNGTDTFTYKANDGELDSNISTVTIIVNPVNDAPIAYDFSKNVDEDSEITFALRETSPGSNTGTDNEGGVYDPDIETDQDDDITFSIVTQPSNGTAELITNNDIKYTPNANFIGTDTFTYKGNDGALDSNVATISMIVSNANDDEPVTNSVTVSTDEDNDIDISLTAEEYDGDSYSFSLKSNPSNGTVSLNGSTATYSPSENWFGTDTFTFEATDDTDRSVNIATATITVNSVNDAPVVQDSVYFETIYQFSGIDIENIIATDIEDDGTQWSVFDPTGGGYSRIINDNFTDTNSIRYYPNYQNKSFFGPDTVKFNVKDSDSTVSNTAMLTFDVRPLVTRDLEASDQNVVHELVKVSDGLFIAGYNNDEIYAAKFSLDGDFLWEQKYSFTDRDVGYAASATPSGDLIIAGFQRETIDGWPTHKLIVMKVDGTSGAFLWHNSYDIYDESQGVDVRSDGTIFVSTGNTSANSKLSALLLDSSGNIIWEYTYEIDTQNSSIAEERAIATSDGGFLIGGYVYTGNKNIPLLVKLDENGTVLWDNNYDFESSSHRVKGLIESSSGDFYFVSDYTIAKVSSDGALVWSTSVSDTYSGYLKSIAIDNDNQKLYVPLVSGKILKVNPSDGSIEGSKVFGNRRSMMNMDYIIFSNESGVDKLFIAGNHVATFDNSLDTYGLICIDQDFIPYW